MAWNSCRSYSDPCPFDSADDWTEHYCCCCCSVLDHRKHQKDLKRKSACWRVWTDARIERTLRIWTTVLVSTTHRITLILIVIGVILDRRKNQSNKRTRLYLHVMEVGVHYSHRDSYYSDGGCYCYCCCCYGSFHECSDWNDRLGFGFQSILLDHHHRRRDLLARWTRHYKRSIIKRSMLTPPTPPVPPPRKPRLDGPPRGFPPLGAPPPKAPKLSWSKHKWNRRVSTPSRTSRELTVRFSWTMRGSATLWGISKSSWRRSTMHFCLEVRRRVELFALFTFHLSLFALITQWFR